MAKDKVTVTLDPGVIADADADAADEGLNRSELVEIALRDLHYRKLLAKTQWPGNLPGTEAEGLRALLDWQADPDQAAA
jgi:hypothetical protein